MTSTVLSISSDFNSRKAGNLLFYLSFYAVNSLVITLISVVANVFVNAFIAYGFAKLDFKGKKIWFLIVLGTMMIPGFVTLIPQYVLFAKLHLLNTYYPLVLPALATVAIFTFNGVWNDFLGPLLYINDENLYTLQIGLQVFKERSTTQWNYLMAGSLMVLLPVIVLFFMFQRYFIQGSNITGQSSVDK